MFLFCLFQSAESLVSTHELESSEYFLRIEEVQCNGVRHEYSPPSKISSNLIQSTCLDLTKMFADKKAVVAKYEIDDSSS